MAGTANQCASPRTLILGLGRFGGGREATRFLSRRGHAIRVADRAKAESLAATVAELRDLPAVEWCLGREDAALLDGIDLVVVNPAIPDAHPLLAIARARGIACTQEVELFLREYPGRVVLVTGTNGKSTTTMLCARALERGGLDVLCGGNIGHSLLADEARWSRDQVAVLEVSSFQLDRLDPERHGVEAAVFTRVTRDHIDRHGTVEAYRAAKARAALAARGFVVHAADDPVAASYAAPHADRLTHRRGARRDDEAAWIDEGWIHCSVAGSPIPVVHADALTLLGGFHTENAMAAAIVAARLGASPHGAALAIATATALPHRLQLAAVIDGVRYYDNGVSTALESTESALDALGGPAARGARVHWVGGGKSKEGEEFYPLVADALAPRVASAHVFGAAAPALDRELRARRVPITAHDRLEDALVAAREAARTGDAVLFSPAFASFDQFANFRQRAEAFRAWLALARRAPRLRTAHEL